MKKNNTLTRVLIGGLAANLLLILAGALFYFFMIYPLHTDVARARQSLSDLQKKEASLDTAGRELEERREDFMRVDNAFLNPEEVISFVTLLEATARKHKVSLSKTASINTDPKAPKHGVFTMTTAGSFANIMPFLTAMEHLPYFTDITQLSITGTGQESGQLQMELHVQILTL